VTDEHPSIDARPAERAAWGRSLRGHAPRSSQARYEPAADRRDPVQLLKEQDLGRVPELVPLRYARMLGSPFAFYRGAARLMAHDLAATPRSGIDVQCCGDAHLGNFGAFGTAEHRLVFGVNDFDETLPGPFEWDLKRLATSILIAGRGNGFPVEQQRRMVLGAIAEYRQRMRTLAAVPNLELWYIELDVATLARGLPGGIERRLLDRVAGDLTTARAGDDFHAVARVTERVGGVARIAARPPVLVPLEDFEDSERRAQIADDLRAVVHHYPRTLQRDRQVLLRSFTFRDAARKVVGVGSVGMRDWVALLAGRDDHDLLLLQIKEARESVLEDVLPASTCSSAGHRVVAGQQLMQASSDLLLGWTTMRAAEDGVQRDYYVRQLRNWKSTLDIDALDAPLMDAYARLCAASLAIAHARSGDRIALAAYLGKARSFDLAVLRFSESYAAQNEADHHALVRAARAGEVPTHSRDTQRSP
jgi:uncharacterized protein (DUF2252 family)